jgi:hypothetical protein
MSRIDDETFRLMWPRFLKDCRATDKMVVVVVVMVMMMMKYKWIELTLTKQLRTEQTTYRQIIKRK